MYFEVSCAAPESGRVVVETNAGAPGDCLALRGAKGYVDVHLKEKMVSDLC